VSLEGIGGIPASVSGEHLDAARGEIRSLLDPTLVKLDDDRAALMSANGAPERLVRLLKRGDGRA
jgi:hypothetical protein